MTKKQLKQLAKQIATYEQIIQNNLDTEEVRDAKEKVMRLSNNLSLEDMLALDEYIQDLMKK